MAVYHPATLSMKIDRSKIKLVDAFKIRNTLDDDFAILHGHGENATAAYQRFYIPKGEWWLDHRCADELEFIVATEEVEAPPSMKTYADWRAHIKKTMCYEPPVPPPEHRREEKEGYALVMVDGAIVRQYLDPEFIGGGHEFVYDYVPKGEIWVDVKIDPKEVPFIVLHEQVERELMKGGKNYDIAHDYATVTDKEARRVQLGTRYPLDYDYPWRGKTNKELAQEYYV